MSRTCTYIVKFPVHIFGRENICSLFNRRFIIARSLSTENFRRQRLNLVSCVREMDRMLVQCRRRWLIFLLYTNITYTCQLKTYILVLITIQGRSLRQNPGEAAGEGSLHSSILWQNEPFYKYVLIIPGGGAAVSPPPPHRLRPCHSKIG